MRSSCPRARRSAPLCANRAEAWAKSCSSSASHAAPSRALARAALLAASSSSAGSASTPPASAGPRSGGCGCARTARARRPAAGPARSWPRSSAHCRAARRLSCSRSSRASHTACSASLQGRRGLLGQRHAPAQVPVAHRGRLARCAPAAARHTAAPSPAARSVASLRASYTYTSDRSSSSSSSSSTASAATSSPAQTASAAATSQPPANTASRRNSACSAGSSRP